MNIKSLNIKKVVLNILIFIFIFIVCFSNIMTKTIGNLDEIWNYNFARNMADGLVPYKDFNMVPMPGLFMICAVVFKIFGNQLIVMRFLAVILMSVIFFMGYKILEYITKKEIALLLLILLLVVFKDILCIDYNYATLLIALVLLFLEIKREKENILEFNFRSDFLLGLIAGISILFKQTTGLAISLACIGYKIFAIREKSQIKIFLKIAFTRLLGVLIPVFCLIIYLIINDAIVSFVDYTILGLKTFSNKIPYSDWLKENLFLGIIVPLSIVIMFILLFFKKTKKYIYPFFAYSISSFVVTFPISDKIHFFMGSFITFLAITYLIYELCIKGEIGNFNKVIRLTLYGIMNFFTIFLLLILLFSSIAKIQNDYIEVDKENKLTHFEGIPENIGLNERIFEIDDYILKQRDNGKVVYILDAEAAIYNIPLDIYHKDYDMFNKGNLGAKGEQGIIDRIKDEKNAIYLIKKDNLNWQNPNEVREYILDNLSYKGEISIFWIFENNM